MKSDKEYFYSNYSLGWIELFFTMSASYLGAASFVALSSEASKKGFFSLFVIPFPAAVSLFVSALVSKRLISKRGKSFGEIFSEELSISEKYTDFIMMWYLILLTSSQIRALIEIGSLFFKDGKEIIYALFAFTLFYTLFYGFKGVVLSDIFQIFLILPGVFVLSKEAFKSKIFFLSDFFKSGFSLHCILIFLLFSIAWTISPITLQRILSSKDVKSVKRGFLSSALFLLFVYSIIVFSSFISGHDLLTFLLQLSTKEKFLVLLSIVFAILSTLDTTLNTSSLLLRKLIGVKPFISTAFVAFSGVGVAFLGESILKLLGFSSEVMVYSFTLPFLFFLLNKKSEIHKKFSKLVLVLGFVFSLFSFTSNILNLKYLSWPFSAISYFVFLLILYFIVKIFSFKS